MRLRAGRGPTIPSLSPGPADQMIFTDVMHDIFERATAIAGGIFDLFTDLSERLVLPAHLMRGEMPARIARHPGGLEIGRLVADRAATGPGLFCSAVKAVRRAFPMRLQG